MPHIIITRAIAFITSDIPDSQTLIDGILKGIEVTILDPKRNAVAQIAETIKGKQYSAIHIISHGAPGHIQLGNTELNSQTLPIYSQQIQQWRESLTEDAEIIIYGCNVAATTDKVQPNFLHQLHQLTGANIAASAHPVGNPSKGGTWNLEHKLGNITSPIAFSPEVCNAYPGIFPASFATPSNFGVGTSPVSVTVGDFNGDGKTDIAAANANSNNVSVLLGTGTGSFGAATNFAVGTNPYSVTVGDFNG
ncbi:DUF4347 domain-containing protein, partial [Microcoleus sp. A6-D4]